MHEGLVAALGSLCPMPLVWIAAEGHIVDCNAAASALFERPRERLLGADFATLAFASSLTTTVRGWLERARLADTPPPLGAPLPGHDRVVEWRYGTAPAHDAPLPVFATVTERRADPVASLLANLRGAAYRERIDDHARTIEYIGPGILELTGYPPEAFTSGELHLHDLILPAERERVAAAGEEAQLRGSACIVEYRVRHRSGAVRWLWQKTSARHETRGGASVRLVEGFVTDVSDQKRAEHALEERIKELRCLFDIGEVLTCADCEIEAVAQRIAARLASAFRFPAEVVAEVVLEGHASDEAEPGGPHVLSVPILDGSGSPLGRLAVRRVASAPGEQSWDAGESEGYFLDEERTLLELVADRLAAWLETRRATEALRQSEARARAIYHGLPIATYVWQRGADGIIRAIETNEAGHRLAPRFAEGILGRTAREAWAGRPDILADFERCFANGVGHQREIEYQPTPDAPPLQLAVSYGFVPPDLVLAHAQDVTEQRRTERELFEARKLEAIGRLAGGVAHDFNNLLAVINSYTELVLDELPEIQTAVRQDLLEVLAAGERAALLTRQLLAYGRRQFLRPAVLDLDAVLAAVASMLERLLGDSIELVIEPSSAAALVFADPSQLDQVLVNLVVNARDAMPHGGRLTLRTTLAPPSHTPPVTDEVTAHSWVVLQCIDTGIGMDDATRSRVFEPFFTTRAVGEGSGLGLATVYGIVRQSGGYIAVESAPGQGACFTVWLPHAAVRVESPAGNVVVPLTRRHAVEGVGRTRVLVVEDDESLRTLVSRVLGNAGYEVRTAASAEEAVALMTELGPEAFGLLLTDVVMPGIGGRLLVERLLARRSTLPVVFMSGYTEDVLVRNGQLEANTHFLAKPFTASELVRKVAEVIDCATTTTARP